ncbi:MAG: Hsp70 family protein, partial [Myxococcaceae bacterium]|nr:Hsp70 family protein [Myxococcaceae bacterium]
MAFIIGIDLGTSNCAVAFTDARAGASAPIVDFPVPQLARPGELVSRALYPSVVYLPAEGEFPVGSTAMPWGGGARVTGAFARWQAGRVPQRAVVSAKSWLIHPGVDRQAAILPWGAPGDVPRLSPVAAQAELLAHLAAAWNGAHPGAPLAEQEVVLTIPASFDEAARALTLQAARDAGFPLNRLTLLEEPQAAFYDFTARHRDALAAALAGVRLVLVVDVGGGTTDFSLVQVAMLPEGPALQRLAVGDHLLLGGDNMDAALARRLEARLAEGGKALPAALWAQAVQQARAAKEALLAAGGPDQHPVSLVAGGSRLVGNTLSATLTRAEVLEAVVQGFFPVVDPAASPTSAPRGGVVELGLPYTKDPAITRHLVAFLRAHAAAGLRALGQPPDAGLPRPDAILLNGGVFNAPALADALVDAVSALFPGRPRVPTLPHDSLDLAVARGAAYSGLARRALGKKIGGGAPRAFYA